MDDALDYMKNYGGFEAVFITDQDEVFITSGLKNTFTPEESSGYTFHFLD